MPSENGSAKRKRLAAIDIGSNSIRLMVAEAAADGEYRVLDDEKQTTRLARGLSRNGKLGEQAMAASIETLKRMKAIAEGYAVEHIGVIATSAVREAANRRRFVRLVRDQVGLDVHVIPTTEEGELSFRSVERHFNLKHLNAACVDLGGGSAEIIFATKGIIEDIFSLPIGSVRLTEACIRSDPLSREDFTRLKRRIRRSFEEIVGKPDFTPHVMIGSGGTFTALANISMRMRGTVYSSVGGYEMSRSEVRHILDYLRRLSLRQRQAVPGLNADRADIIVAGVCVIERLMKLLRVNRLQMHERGIRDGLLLNLIGQAYGKKARLADDTADALTAVQQFAAACGYEEQHSRHVAVLATQLFDGMQERLRLPAEERLLLEAAALLHEIGYLINYEKHHQHSYHLIMHGNLRGLSPKQRELIANIARYHRRSGPKTKHANFARLDREDRKVVERLSAILRLADGLDRAHMQRIKGVACHWQANRLLVSITAEQLPDVDLWGAQSKGKLFEKVFKTKLAFVWRPAEKSHKTNGAVAKVESRTAT
jgi:exopolyphosphatase/guanosine-5'-triphosphate,3'-diphosphate pyrophosphatase